jgi:hypothetical protein
MSRAPCPDTWDIRDEFSSRGACAGLAPIGTGDAGTCEDVRTNMTISGIGGFTPEVQRGEIEGDTASVL